MHRSDDGPGESRSAMRRPWRSGALPVEQRERVSHCDIGDQVELEDGRLAIVTCSITGTIFGRFIEAIDGDHGPMVELPDVPCKRIKGYR